MINLSDAEYNQVKAYIAQGKRVEAISVVRKWSNSDLRSSLTYVDKLISKTREEDSNQTQEVYTVDIPDYVSNFQNHLKKNISLASGVCPEVETLMDALEEQASCLVEDSLGDFGKLLLNFSNDVFHDHPSFEDVNNGTLLKGGKVYNRVLEILAITQIAKEKSFNEMPKILRDWFNRNHKSISKIMAKPHPRLLKDPKKRKKARMAAKPKDISLSSVYEAGRRKTWDSLVDSFIPYCRLGPGLSEECNFLTRMMKEAESSGMVSQAAALKDDIERMNDMISDQYMGFSRIKMVDAALIAAKAMGLSWSTKVFFDPEFFKEQFWKTEKNEDDGFAATIFDKHVQIEANYHAPLGIRFNYTPRAYPIDRFDPPMSKDTEQIIKDLENHADAKGYPLFDQYWVVCPTITLTQRSKDYFSFREGTKVNKYYDYWQYANALDSYLVRSGQIFPVILGEHHGRKGCYFIGYWT